MSRYPRSWKHIMSQLARESRNVTNARSHRTKLNDPAIIEFWESYLVALRTLGNRLALWMNKYTPQGYAAAHNMTLSDPPVWTDFVPVHIKTAFIQEQGTLSNFERTHKQVFDKPPPTKEERARLEAAQALAELKEAFMRELDTDEEMNNLLMEERPNYPWAIRRAEQLAKARYRYAQLPKGAAQPTTWTQMLTSEELAMPHDDTPHVTYYHEPHLPPAPDIPTRRGRPPGVKDSQPRKRAAYTPEQRAARAALREKKKAYERTVSERLLEQRRIRDETVC